MSFLNPLLLLGLLGASVPIIIHLIHKRKPRQQRFAAIELILKSVERVERRWRLRRFLLLAARVLLLAALSLAAAGPVLLEDKQTAISASGPQRLAIVLDASLSMRARYDGTSAFSRAQTKARNIIDAMGPEDQAVLVVARKVPTLPISRPTPDRARLLKTLGELEPSFEHASLAEAITKGVKALGSLKEGEAKKTDEKGAPKISGRVVVLSDLAQAAIDAAADLKIPGSDSTASLELIDVLEGQEKRPNHALTRLEATNVPGRAPRTVEIKARIQSFMPESNAQPKPADITLRSDDKDLWVGSVDLVEGTIADKVIRHAFDQPGHMPVEVLLEADALAEDDIRYLSTDIRRQVRALIVDGAPSGVPKEDEIFYLERALAAGAADQPPPRVITADDLVRTDLSAFDVVILAGVASFGRAEGARLVEFVKKGGGLMITASEDLDTELYNAELGPILPRSFRGLKITDVDLGSSGVVTLAKPALEHPVMRIFQGDSQRGLLSTRTRGYLLFQPGGERPFDVLVEHEDGQPALIESRAAQGRIVILTTSIDRDLSDLPIRPAFLPLMRQLLLRLGNALSEPDTRRTLVGEPRQLKVPSSATRLVVTSPAGKETAWERTELQTSKVLFKGTQVPGHYEVEVAFAGPLEPLASERFAVNVESRESDLRPMPLEEALAVLQGSEINPKDKTKLRSFGGRLNPESMAGVLLLLMVLAFVFESALTAQKIGR